MRDIRLALSIATRYLLRKSGGNRRRTISAIAGIALSMVPLILVMELADGMIRGITSRYVETGTYHLQAYPSGDLSPAEFRARAQELREIPGVQNSVVEHRGVGLLSAPGGKSGVQLRSLSPTVLEKDRGFRKYLRIDDGSFDIEGDEDIVLGRYLAEELEVGPGDEVRLLTVRSLEGRSFLPRVSTFVVRGVVSTGYQELDRLWAFVSLKRGLAVLPPENADTFIGIKIDNPYALEQTLFGSPLPSLEDLRATRSAEKTVGAVTDSLGFNWRAYSWYNLERSRYVSFQTSRNLLLFIMALIVVVAAVNVSSTLVMLVVEKEQEIAFLRTLGATPALIERIFLAAGALIGALGVGVGAVLGVALAVNVNELLLGLEQAINSAAIAGRAIFAPDSAGAAERILLFSQEFYLEEVPITIDPLELGTLVAVGMLLALLAAIVPARRSVQVYPLELLRRH